VENITRVFTAIKESLHLNLGLKPEEFYQQKQFLVLGHEPYRIDIKKLERKKRKK